MRKRGLWWAAALGAAALWARLERRAAMSARVRANDDARRRLLGGLQSEGPDDSDLAGEITIVVTACDRPCCIVRFLESVRRYFPTVPVLVCDNSRDTLLPHGAAVQPAIRWLHPAEGAPHTVGAGRNRLLAHVETPFFFLCDDDHVFTSATDLRRMLTFLHDTGYDLVAGCQGRGDYGTAIFEMHEGLAVQRFYRHRGVVGDGAVDCDRVSNSWLARTDSVRAAGGWEARVFAAEHAEFFLRCSRRGLRVAQMAGVWVDHDTRCERVPGLWGGLRRLLPHPDPDYAERRSGGRGWGHARRARELERRWCWEKNGVRGIVGRSTRRERLRFLDEMRVLEERGTDL